MTSIKIRALKITVHAAWAVDEPGVAHDALVAKYTDSICVHKSTMFPGGLSAPTAEYHFTHRKSGLSVDRAVKGVLGALPTNRDQALAFVQEWQRQDTAAFELIDREITSASCAYPAGARERLVEAAKRAAKIVTSKQIEVL